MKILIIGESCTDIFYYGECNRMCPEAPVPVFNPTEILTSPGMAMNVQRNIESLIKEDVDIYTNKNWEQITKTRYIDYRTNHMFMRLDENDFEYHKVHKFDDLECKKYDAIVISDYNKGFLSCEDIYKIGTKNPCVFLDTKKVLGDWCDSVNFIKINEYEYKRSKHMIGSNLNKFEKKLIITLGSKGCLYGNNVFPVPRVEIKDLSGAGDTFIAALVVKYIETKKIETSLLHANQCATEVVQKRGVAIVG
jgi:D-beta-D-heptose 7-phosphate kinase/D-beta-D-heptose 1-phosphate adenosyltransferase